jgi:hypothetical protein
MVHESIPLSEEKRLVKEIRTLKKPDQKSPLMLLTWLNCNWTGKKIKDLEKTRSKIITVIRFFPSHEVWAIGLLRLKDGKSFFLPWLAFLHNGELLC